LSEPTVTKEHGRLPDASIRFFGTRKVSFTSCRHLPDGSLLSPFGLGTRFGACDDLTDEKIAKLVRLALAIGVNVFETSPGYRQGRSEQVLCRTLSNAVTQAMLRRDEICVINKVGCLDNGTAGISPATIRTSLEDSLRSSQLDLFDVVLIRSPECFELTFDDWMPQFLEVCALLEEFRSKGKLRWYGLSSWSGFLRMKPHPLHLPLETIMMSVWRVLGAGHGFRFIQMPLSAEVPQAFNRKTQQLRDGAASVLRAAAELELSVLAVAPFQHGQLFNRYPAHGVVQEPGANLSVPQWMVQFSRSFPGVASCIVGTLNPEHLLELKALLELPPWSVEELTTRI